MNLIKLNKSITECQLCPRLVSFRQKIAKEKRRQYLAEEYWGKPITGYGDTKAKLLMIGLAPAAHGGNRTGRVFTGDRSSDFLYKCLYGVKISNHPYSDNIKDGLELKNAYITTALKCVPPGDKPYRDELNNCFSFFHNEIRNLKNLKTIIALGKIAFDSCVLFFKENYDFKDKVYFSHGKIYTLPKNINLVACYHPSPRNVNTGRINEKKMKHLFKKALELN